MSPNENRHATATTKLLHTTAEACDALGIRRSKLFERLAAALAFDRRPANG